MCNLYSITKGQSAIRDLFRPVNDRIGNLPPLPGVFPDYPAPIVRVAAPVWFALDESRPLAAKILMTGRAN